MEEEMSHTVQKASAVHVSRMSSCNIHPNQLGLPARLYIEDPPFSHGIEHHSSRHRGFDGEGAVDADR